MTKRAIESNAYLTTLVGLLRQLLNCKPARLEGTKTDAMARMQQDILSIKEEIRMMKNRSATAS